MRWRTRERCSLLVRSAAAAIQHCFIELNGTMVIYISGRSGPLVYSYFTSPPYTMGKFSMRSSLKIKINWILKLSFLRTSSVVTQSLCPGVAMEDRGYDVPYASWITWLRNFTPLLFFVWYSLARMTRLSASQFLYCQMGYTYCNSSVVRIK